jgi:hypothetical protein
VSPDRRTVLKAAGITAVGIGAGLAGWRLVEDGDGAAAPTTTAPTPPDPVSSLDAALVAVGTRYLAVTPEEADRQVLLDALPPLEGMVPERPGQGLAVLADQAAADHASGEVVVLDSWVLSRTEARAAALYAL